MLVMLDLDNTLADRAGAVAAWAHEFAGPHQWDAALVEWLLRLDNDGYSSRADVFAAIAIQLGIDDPSDLLADYRRRVLELLAPTPGALDCLTALRTSGHVTAIVTNGSTRQQEGKIDRLGLRPLVDAVIVSETVGWSKPDTRLFELAAQRTGSSLGDAWMVGDSAHHDILGARRLGLRTAWLSRGRAWDAAIVEPDLVLRDLTDLTHHLALVPPTRPLIPLPIRTERLVMRAVTESDLDAVHDVIGDPVTTRSVSWGQPDVASTADWIRRRVRQQRTYGYGWWTIELGEFGPLVGLCGFFPHDDTTVELGYVIRSDHWGRGLATEAARSAIHAARTAGLNVVATIRSTNSRSLAVARRVDLVETDSVNDARGTLLTFRTK